MMYEAEIKLIIASARFEYSMKQLSAVAIKKYEQGEKKDER